MKKNFCEECKNKIFVNLKVTEKDVVYCIHEWMKAKEKNEKKKKRNTQ